MKDICSGTEGLRGVHVCLIVAITGFESADVASRCDTLSKSVNLPGP